MIIKPQEGLFKIFNTITIIAVYFLILVGGIVRSMGSGFECPDWPKCFGAYLPPNDESQFPENYQELCNLNKESSNERLASVLEVIGLNGTAAEVVNSHIQKEYEINIGYMWAAFVNRWVGVIVSVLVLLMASISFTIVKKGKRVLSLSILAVVIIFFEWWVAGIVLATEFADGMVTFHMLVALGLIAILIYQRAHINGDSLKGNLSHKPYKVRRLLTLCMMLLFAQLLLGLQVREAIDSMLFHLGNVARVNWIDSLGMVFYIHRSFSILLVLIHGYLIFRLLKSIENFKVCNDLVWTLLICVVLETVLGGVLANFGMPEYIQPIHLLLAFVIFGIQYSLYLIIKEKEKTSEWIAHEK